MQRNVLVSKSGSNFSGLLSGLRTLFFLVLLGLGLNSRALALPVVVWDKDSNASVRVTITGSLLDGLPTGYYTAPSSLWEFEFLFGMLIPHDDNEVEFADGFIVHGTFSGTTSYFFTTPGGFGDSYDSFPASSGDAIYREMEETEYIGDASIEFGGTDFNDLSTWTYTFAVDIENPDHGSSSRVPEGGVTAYLAAFAIGVLFLLRQVFQPSGVSTGIR